MASRSKVYLLVLASLHLATLVLSQGCAPVFSDFQDARLVGPSRAEVTPNFSAVFLSADGEFVGTCSYEHIDEDLCAEVGFDLAKEHGRQGYMTEALGAVITFGFTALGLARIRADTYSSNAGARRVLEKVGFGVHSVEDDSHCYELLRTDWTRSHG